MTMFSSPTTAPPPAAVRITGGFWGERLAVNAARALPHQWQQLEASGCITNFRIAAGEAQGFRTGWFFADSDAYKWLDAAARAYAAHPDPELARRMDEFAALLARAQTPDGYLFTYNQIHFPGTRWRNLQIEHELYCHGHLIEAGVSHYLATGKDTMLTVACKAADRIIADFAGRGPAFTPGHEEIEIALLRLYRVTGRQAYLDLARQFIEQRGRLGMPAFAISLWRQNADVARRGRIVAQQRQEYLASHPGYRPPELPAGNAAARPRGIVLRWYLNALSGRYFQQHAPVRRQSVPVGHAVRFGYLQTAIAMLHRLTGDETLLPALCAAWEHMVCRRMYVTGGIGSLPGIEGFGRDYELDPEYAYAETCAALACLFWNREMALITGEAKYSDLFEWQLYNAAAVGMGWGGESYLYNNPLACRGGVTRRSWYAVPCCPSNLSRTWASLAEYLYSIGEGDLWVHQYASSQADLGGGLRITMVSELPWEGKVRLRLEAGASALRTLYLRIPSWAGAWTLSLNGQPVRGSAVGIFRPDENLRSNGFSRSAQADATEVATTKRRVFRPDEELGSNGFSRSAQAGATEVATTKERIFLPGQARPPAPTTACGYDPRAAYFVAVAHPWRDGDELILDFAPDIRLHRQDPRLPRCGGRAAISRGPLVYCLESTDNPGLSLFDVALDPDSLRAAWDPDLLGGAVVLRGQTRDGQPLTFIPYFLWANRGPSQMNVFVDV